MSSKVYNQMRSEKVDFALLSTYAETHFVYRRTINGLNTLIFSESITNRDLTVLHCVGWCLHSLTPNANALYNDPDMSLVKSWFNFKKMNTSKYINKLIKLVDSGIIGM